MSVQQQSRFSGGDQENINKLLHDYLDSAVKEEGNDQPFVAPGMQAERDRIWTVWTEYVFPPSFPGFPMIQISILRMSSTPQKMMTKPHGHSTASNPRSSSYRLPLTTSSQHERGSRATWFIWIPPSHKFSPIEILILALVILTCT
ncbi:hypothetical protein QBC37DRAFT_380459 [Rhypophila decipiens]|uniref:Uncharacterized protein n=1 Tax=Rhypophila decipiens TaxID=261697 RepID=A0AAN7B1S1_9PEZI|nr:hypothetical protein QBC37DRAFT_380459 [Rhypophila decipiens]